MANSIRDCDLASLLRIEGALASADELRGSCEYDFVFFSSVWTNASQRNFWSAPVYFWMTPGTSCRARPVALRQCATFHVGRLPVSCSVRRHQEGREGQEDGVKMGYGREQTGRRGVEPAHALLFASSAALSASSLCCSARGHACGQRKSTERRARVTEPERGRWCSIRVVALS